jgi:hypothetical protein
MISDAHADPNVNASPARQHHTDDETRRCRNQGGPHRLSLHLTYDPHPGSGCQPGTHRRQVPLRRLRLVAGVTERVGREARTFVQTMQHVGVTIRYLKI